MKKTIKKEIKKLEDHLNRLTSIEDLFLDKIIVNLEIKDTQTKIEQCKAMQKSYWIKRRNLK